MSSFYLDGDDMPSTRKFFDIDGLSIASRAEVADYSSADHAFSSPTYKGIQIWNDTGADATLMVRFRQNDADTTWEVPARAQIWFCPIQITHIRHTGSTAGLTVIGFTE